nr:hypothetical protein Josef01_05d18_48 [uncultured archaeon]
MGKNIVGFVFYVIKFDNGDIEIGFYNKDSDSADNYSTDESRGRKLSKEIAQTLADTLGRNIWAKIHFNEKGAATKVELEEYDFEKDVHRLKQKLSKLVVTGR